ncbi:MAG: T9SS type A sorting domain-containing protein [Bacteroidetes bacterium]|nr:T9SS type A sorting domain-containing protein [Bacteroidota bacterium]
MKKVYIIITLLILLYGRSTLANTNHVAFHPAPIPNFVINHFCYGDSSYFINTTQMGVTYIWNVYELDATGFPYDTLYTSTNFNISYMFADTGMYRVELIANNGHIVSTSKLLHVSNTVTANFDYQPCGGQFSNSSVCFDQSYWDFGDGTTSTEESPIHFYSAIGMYTVTLIATKGNMSDTIAVPLNVQMANTLNPTFTLQILKDTTLYYQNDTLAWVPTDSILVHFQVPDTSSGPMTEYHWSFGDEGVADLYGYNGGRDVYHRYANVDTVYTVFLLVKTICTNAFSAQSFSFYDHPVYTNGTERIYPNPVAGDYFHFYSKRAFELTDIRAVNDLGQTVHVNILNRYDDGLDIGVSDLASGVYVVQLYFGNDPLTLRFIKE